jgi:hypothetical protein
MKWHILIAVLLPLASLGQSANTVVGADLDTTRIRIGEQVDLRLHITYTMEAMPSIQWPVIGDTLNAHVEIVRDPGIDTTSIGPVRQLQERTLTLTSFDTGSWAIPPFRFLVNGEAIESAPMLLEVQGVALDSAMVPRDIKDIHTLPFSITYWLRDNWTWVAGAFGLSALVAALVLLIQRRRRAPAAASAPEVQLPVHVRTLAAMRALEDQRLWQQGDHKAYHSKLTDILRGYIEERYQVPALESTTDELIKELRVSSLPTEQRDRLENMLRLADLVKFAKTLPSPQENEQMMAGGIQFVETTAPRSTTRDAEQ